jgi:solute carrier family 25 carnitine/acylcarnitine transporter 20/29
MDSVMLGSLHTYRRWISSLTGQDQLSLFGHGVAGAMAGFTVSFVAAPIEHVKARLQVQYSAKDRIYKGPIDAYRKIVPPQKQNFCVLELTGSTNPTG